MWKLKNKSIGERLGQHSAEDLDKVGNFGHELALALLDADLTITQTGMAFALAFRLARAERTNEPIMREHHPDVDKLVDALLASMNHGAFEILPSTESTLHVQLAPGPSPDSDTSGH